MSDEIADAALRLVLIAEDEGPIAEVVSEIVEELGCMPLVATHGREALQMARTLHPALLITDLMMPYLSGSDLIAALRADAALEGHAAVPMILMTAAGPQQARLAGADAVIHKPFDLDELERIVARYLPPAG